MKHLKRFEELDQYSKYTPMEYDADRQEIVDDLRQFIANTKEMLEKPGLTREEWLDITDMIRDYQKSNPNVKTNNSDKELWQDLLKFWSLKQVRE